MMKTLKCATHPDVDSIHVDTARENAPVCVTCVVKARLNDQESARYIRKLCEVEKPLAPGTHSAKVCFQVLAGIVPGKVSPEFTEEWWITEDFCRALRATISPDGSLSLFETIDASTPEDWRAARTRAEGAKKVQGALIGGE
jgi:hypothetical protein